MTNFIFKSQKTSTYKKLANQLEVVLNEQRLQRSDLQEIKFMLHKLQTNKDLQTTVDKFYDHKDLIQDATDLDRDQSWESRIPS